MPARRLRHRPIAPRHRCSESVQRSVQRVAEGTAGALRRNWRIAASVTIVVVGLLTAAGLSLTQPGPVSGAGSADISTSTPVAGRSVDRSVRASLVDRATRVGSELSRSAVRPPTVAAQRATKTGALPSSRQALVRGVTKTVPPPTPRAIAASMLSRYGWGSDQFSCLDQLWVSESDWNPRAVNWSSGAYGIPQALPPEKMASAGADWRNNPATQIEWGLEYIRLSYATPCGAWAFKLSNSWY